MTILAWIIDFALLAVLAEVVLNKKTDWIWDVFTSTATRRGLSLTCIAALIAARVMIYCSQKRSLLEQQFLLIKEGGDLTPEDLNFETVGIDQLGRTVSARRPYVPGTYLQRSAIPYIQRQSKGATKYDEAELCLILRRGRSILLIGPPTDGKTRTLFELVSRLNRSIGFSVVIPRRDITPSQGSIELLRDKRVILLLDDLNAYDGSAINLIDLYRSISDVAASCVMLATSRLGPDLMTASSSEFGLGRLFENFETFALVPATIEQQQLLAKHLNQTFIGAVPTLGFISMRGVFELMRKRFDTISPLTRDCFRALQLMAAGGVEPYEIRRVHIVVKSVFGRSVDAASIRDAIVELASHGFILSSCIEPAIHPHTAFLVGPAASMFYGDQGPEGALVDLARCFHEHDDFRSANKVGVALFLNQRQASALEVWQRTVELSEGHAAIRYVEAEVHALFNMGMALDLLNDPGGSIVTYNALLGKVSEYETPQIASIVARTLSAKTRTLATLGKYDDALEANSLLEQRFSQSADPDISISVARSREYSAGVHALRNDMSAAESKYTEIVTLYEATTTPELQEVLAFALKNRARIWADRGECDRAIVQYDQIISKFSAIKRPRMAGVIAETLLRKAITLFSQNRLQEASAPLEQLYRDFGKSKNQGARRSLSITDQVDDAIMAPSIEETVAHGLSFLHGIQIATGMYSDADTTLTHLLSDFGGSRHSEIKKHILMALRNRAAGLFETGDSTAALKACRELGRTFVSDEDAAIRYECATHLFSLGDVLYKRDARLDDAAAVFSIIGDLFKNDSAPNLRLVAAGSLVNLSIMYGDLNKNKDAIEVCDLVISLFSAASDPELQRVVYTARQNRAIALRKMSNL